MKNQFNSIGIIAKQNDEQVVGTVRSLYALLKGRQIRTIADKSTQQYLTQPADLCMDVDDMHAEIDLAVVVGGDGTLLAAAQSMLNHDIPIIGINRGRLGFLTDIPPANLDTDLNDMLNGECFEEKRPTLSATVMRDHEVIAQRFAINDIVAHALTSVRIIDLETRINDEFLNTLRADGLVVSTPTGSTAYALSGGGPIVHPTANNTILVPICPHTLSNRPIVVNNDHRLEIIYSDSNQHPGVVAVDGQMISELNPGDSIVIEKSHKPLILIQPNSYSFFNVLREKLNWSQQP